MPVISSTGTVTPTPSEQVVCSIAGGPFDNVSVYVQGGAGGSTPSGVPQLGSPSPSSPPLLYRLYATVGGFQTLVAQSQVVGSITPGFGPGSLVEWLELGAGSVGSSQDARAGGTAYTLTVAGPGLDVRLPVTATIAGVNTFDTASPVNFGAPLTSPPGQEVFLPALNGYAQLMDVGIDQSSLQSVSITVYANCGFGSVTSVVKSVVMSGQDGTIASVFRGLTLPVASSYFVSLTSESLATVTATLTAATYSVAAAGGGGGPVTLGGDVTGPSGGNTVVKINGATVPLAGAVGNVLQVAGINSLTYGAVNLAGGGGFVTGMLPNANQAPQILTGDVTGTTAASVVVKINGAAVSAAGALTIGNGLFVTGASTLSYSALNLAGGPNFVTGILPAANMAPQPLGGDLSGTTSAATVAAIQGVVISGAPSAGNVLTATSALAAHWAAPAGTTAITQITGDVAAGPGPGSVVATVTRINGATVPTAGALVTGNVLQVSAASALIYAALNLAGGANFVTGILPAANQAAQVLGGDLSGTTAAATVAAIQSVVISGSPAVGNVLTATGALAAHWAAPAGSGFVAGGDLSGTATTQTVEAIQGVVITGAAAIGNVLTATSAIAAHWAAPAGSGFVAGGDLTGTSVSQTVNAIQGVVITGAAAAGEVLTATSAIAAHWAAPAVGAITQLTGDVTAGPGSGSVAATVVRINGATVPAAGALTVGNGLYVTGASALSYSALNLAGGANFVTGLLPTANQVAQPMGGDISGTTASATVAAIQGVVISGAAAAGEVLTATSALAAHWAPAPGGITQLTGDVTAGPGSGSVAATVLRIHGATVSAAGALVTGNGLYVTGPSALTYSALNLAGGANFVTGILPAANQAAQTLTGDVTGTTAASVVARINGATVPAAGALVTGNVLQVIGPSTLSYGPLALTGEVSGPNTATVVTGPFSQPALRWSPAILGASLGTSTAGASFSLVGDNGLTAIELIKNGSGAFGTIFSGAMTDIAQRSEVANYIVDSAGPDQLIRSTRAGNVFTLPDVTLNDGRILTFKEETGTTNSILFMLSPHPGQDIDGIAGNMNYYTPKGSITIRGNAAGSNWDIV